MSLGPHVGLRIFEISHGALVPVAANVRDVVATLDQTTGITFDEGGQSNDLQKANGSAVSIVLLQSFEQDDAATLSGVMSNFDEADYVLVFCLRRASPTSINAARPATAVVIAEDLSDILIPIRQLRSASGLIGIDLGDVFSVWSGRVSHVQTVSSHQTREAVRNWQALAGIFLSFPKAMSLEEIDRVMEELRDVLPADVDLVWRDGGEQQSQLVDICNSVRM